METVRVYPSAIEAINKISDMFDNYPIFLSCIDHDIYDIPEVKKEFGKRLMMALIVDAENRGVTSIRSIDVLHYIKLFLTFVVFAHGDNVYDNGMDDISRLLETYPIKLLSRTLHDYDEEDEYENRWIQVIAKSIQILYTKFKIRYHCDKVIEANDGNPNEFFSIDEVEAIRRYFGKNSNGPINVTVRCINDFFEDDIVNGELDDLTVYDDITKMISSTWFYAIVSASEYIDRIGKRDVEF